jgi:hypothetical protein
MKLEFFSTDFRKILKYQISRKSVQREPSCPMRTDGQTDTTKLIVACHNFAISPKNRTQSFNLHIKLSFLPHRKHRPPPLKSLKTGNAVAKSNVILWAKHTVREGKAGSTQSVICCVISTHPVPVAAAVVPVVDAT